MEDHDSKARYKFAKAEAEKVWLEICEGDIPVMLNKVVKLLQIPTKEADLEVDAITRIDQEGTCIIMYKKDAPRVRQKFSVAHEIGHIVLEHVSFDGSTSVSHSNRNREQEANRFAGELLVPGKDLKKFMKGGDKSIEDIIDRYKVSRDAATIAIQNNRLLNKVAIPD